MKKSVKFNFDTKNQSLYVNNIDLRTITKLDVWMVSFILKVNKMYTHGMLSPRLLKNCEQLMEEYRKYLVGGEKNKNNMIMNINKFTSKQIKFGMMAAPLKKSKVDNKIRDSLSHNVTTVDQFSDSIIQQRYDKLVDKKSVEERFSDLLTEPELAKHERRKEMLDVLDDLGVVDQSQTQVQSSVTEIINIQQQMAESLQNMMATQDKTLSVVNNINSVVTPTKTSTFRNVMSAVTIFSVKSSLKVAFYAGAGLPWYCFKSLGYFSLSGGKRLFGPFIAILSIICFMIQLGNVCYVMTLPCTDFLVPNKYSAIQATYPMIEQKKDRFSLVDQFKNDVINISDVVDVSYLDFKYHSEGYKILTNMNMYNRIYHTSTKIPRIIMDEISLLTDIQQFYFFRGWHLVIDLSVNLERPGKGYKRAMDLIVGTTSVIEWFDTAAYKSQMGLYETCIDKFPSVVSTYICGEKPVFNSKRYNEVQEKQKKYLEWKECTDYNNNLSYMMKKMWEKDCGIEPEKYDPTKKFVKVIRDKTIGEFIYEKGRLYLSPTAIKKQLKLK